MLCCNTFKVIKRVAFFKPGDIIQVDEAARIGMGDYCIFKKGNRTKLKKYKGKDTEYVVGKVVKLTRDMHNTPFYTIEN